MPDYPKRQGYRLTEEGENLYGNWLDMRSCSCHTGCAPCSTCTHEGHPISLEESDEVWEIDDNQWEIIPMYNQFQIKDFIHRGWTVEQMIQQNILKLKQEEIMSRTEIKDKGSGSKKSEWFGYKYRVTPETSRLLQEAVFKGGGSWGDGSRSVKGNDFGSLGVTEGGLIYYFSSEYTFIKDPLPEKEPPKQTENFYTAYVTFPNSYSYKEYAYKINYEQYKLIAYKDNVILNVDVGGTIKKVNLARLSNHLDPKATKEIVDIDSIYGQTAPMVLHMPPTTRVGEFGTTKQVVNLAFNLNQQEETNMSNTNRRVVNVKLLDNDSGLPVENSLVAQFDNIVTEDSNDVVVQEILLNKNIADSIAKHNQKRVEQTDLEILKRTGNDVKLRQVKLKDLTWIVTTA